MRLFKKLLPLMLTLIVASTLAAQATSGASNSTVSVDRIAQLQQQVADAKSSADNAWMLVCSALVLMMTGPGLALFYGGLVRKKNVLSTMMQSFAMMAVITVLWALVGYSLCFGSGNSFLGGLSHVFLRGVGTQPDADYAATIPVADIHDLPIDVCHHHSGADQRGLRRTNEVQRHAAVHGAVVGGRLCADGAHGLG